MSGRRPRRGRPDSLDALAIFAILTALVMAIVARAAMPPSLVQVWDSHTPGTPMTYVVVNR